MSSPGLGENGHDVDSEVERTPKGDALNSEVGLGNAGRRRGVNFKQVHGGDEHARRGAWA